MTLVSSIIADAYRENNLVAVGKDPSTGQQTEALRLLLAVVKAAIGGEAGEYLKDWPLGDYGRQDRDQLGRTTTQIANPPINARLLHTAAAAITVYFPAMPSDGSRMAILDPYSRLAALNVTLDGNGRTIEAAATATLSTNGLSREWFYRADLGNWVRVSDFDADDEMPFPADFDMMWVILLAARLSPRYGRSLTNESALILKQQRTAFLARYAQSEDLQVRPDLSLPHLSRQSYGGFRDADDATLYGL